MRTHWWTLRVAVALVALMTLSVGARAQYAGTLPEGVTAATVDGQPINSEATPQVNSATPVIGGTLEPGPTEVEIAIQQNGDVARFTVTVDAAAGTFQGPVPDPLAPGTYSLYFDDELIGDFVVSEGAGPALDLPAMPLGPADVEVDGFGLVYGRLVTLDEQAARFAEDEGDTSPENVTRFRDALTGAGWQLRYENRLAQASEEDASRFGVSITSFVVQFVDDAAATTEFAGISAQTANDEAGTATIGDESEITRLEGTASDTGTPFQGLTVTFRSGDLVAGMTIRDFTNADPGVARVEDLATVFADRIAAVRGQEDEGLSTKVLRLDLSENGAFPDDEETYELIEERTYPRFGDDGDDGEEFDGANVVYRATVFGNLRYAVVLYRFADDGAAGEWLAGVGDRVGDEESGYGAFEEIADAAELGDESTAYGFEFDDGDVTTTGTRYYVRVANEIAQVEVGTEEGTTTDAVAEVVEAQIVCLESGSCVDPVAVPASVRGGETAPVAESTVEAPVEAPEIAPEETQTPLG